MAREMWCNNFVVILVCLSGFASNAGAITGFRTADPLHSITFAQQGQILSDVQQHQHRFGIQNVQDTLVPAQTQNAFARQPIVPLNQPVAFTQGQQFFVQPPTAFQQQIPQQVQSSPQQQLLLQQSLNEQPFLPVSAQNQQIVQPHLLQQNLPNLQQTQSFFQQSQQINGHQQQVPTNFPNRIVPTQHSFLPTIPAQDAPKFKPLSPQLPTNVLRQSEAEVPFQPSLGSNPLFSANQNSQVQSLLDEQRKQDLERLKELQERQNIIQKHKQFLDRQQQKQKAKVQKLHEEFVLKQKKKQDEIYATAKPEPDYILNPQSRPREILPHELNLFQKAVKQYEELHPTTPIITTTTSTTTTPRPKTRTRQRAKSRSEAENQDAFVQSNKQKIYKELKTILQNDEEGQHETIDSSQTVNPSKLQFLQRQDLLKQLKLAIAENSADLAGKNFSSREISLPNGQKVEVIRTSDPNLIAGATPLSADSSSLSQIISSPNQIRTSNQPKMSFEEITKGVLPPGADFQVIKQSDGRLEEVGKLPPNLTNQKKVTFVFIEEQGDGSYKVKGVRGNDHEAKESSQDVDGILNKIKNGELNLPPSSRKTKVTSTKAPYVVEDIKATTFARQTTFAQPTPSSDAASIYDDFEATKINRPVTPAPKYYNSASPSSLSINHNGSPTAASTIYDQTTPSSQTYYTTSKKQVSGSTSYTKIPTTTVNGHQMYSTPSKTTQIQDIQFAQTANAVPSTVASYSTDTISIIPSSSTYYPTTNVVARSTTPKPNDEARAQFDPSSSSPGLVDILKENGLFATAKYLRQSGLDTILNETGPYTIFAPTDKAFRTLLIQLGGPDKAEEKFKENPRLLSGLLLHHVIPGAFEISSLQDEMTGVSLAGTQLRVNQYDMHDVEWNEIKVTTINGGRVISDKQDIAIPQGIAHAIDRVMFPLPVGDIVQTLQADRERRFTNFLKALFASGMTETLSDSRTYTVFAPTDRAFSFLTSEELSKVVSDKEKAKELVTKHVTPGTLFSAGMRYYQVRDSMEEGKPITLQKNAGRIKVNSGHVITHNIPATNGVIHAVDTLL